MEVSIITKTGFLVIFFEYLLLIECVEKNVKKEKKRKSQ